jgi:hypothetical protein
LRIKGLPYPAAGFGIIEKTACTPFWEVQAAFFTALYGGFFLRQKNGETLFSFKTIS